MRSQDVLFGVILLALGFVTRVFALGYPDQVVFDEVHFGAFSSAYCCTSERFFDIHPPHAKLLISFAAYMSGYGGGFDFGHIGQDYGDVSFVAFRLIPALAGVLLPWIAYVLLRQLNVSSYIAFLAGFALVFDNALIVQSRIISLDSMLLAATLGSLALFLRAMRASATWRIPLFALAGGVAGFAVGVKFTGLVSLALLGLATMWYLIRSATRQEALAWVLRGIVMLGCAVVVYLAGWVIHFSILTQPGPGDAWGAPTGHMWTDIVNMHQTMFRANYDLTAEHMYSSKWWQWPLMARSIFYWQSQANGTQLIYLVGNPVVWWGAFALLIAGIVVSVQMIQGRVRMPSDTRGWFLLAGYIIAFAPFMRIPRPLFLYHYLMPLLFGLLWSVWLLDRHISPRLSHKALLVSMGVIFVFFIVFSPVTYGFVLPSWWEPLVFWFPVWR